MQYTVAGMQKNWHIVAMPGIAGIGTAPNQQEIMRASK